MTASTQSSPDSLSQILCTPLAVGHQEEGVCLLLTLGPYNVLLDCGLTDITPLQTLPSRGAGESPADYVICSHAHSDHAQGLLPLQQAFPNLPIAASEPTTTLLPLNWPEKSPTSFPVIQGLSWRSPQEILPRLWVELLPAGHLPGAALILLSLHTARRIYRVLYAGDFCLTNLQLVTGLALEPLRGLQPDVLIIEGQYGTQRFPHRRHQEKVFLQHLQAQLATGRQILLPVPPVGLAQEILKLLRTHHHFSGRPLHLWAGGNVIAACEAYLKILGSLPSAIQNFSQHQSLFWDDKIYPYLRPLSASVWQAETESTVPQIVVIDQWPEGWPEPAMLPGEWTVFYPQDSALPSLPRNLKQETLGALPQFEIENYWLGEHSDGRGITQLIHTLRPQHIVFVHGQPQAIEALTSLPELQSRYQLHSPRANHLVKLPLGDRFLQPSPPTPKVYDGEIQEAWEQPPLGNHENDVMVYLDPRLTTDQRWHRLSETGLVTAHWQGETLVIKGVSQRELQQSRNLVDD